MLFHFSTAVILVPTRELAIQHYKHIQTLTPNDSIAVGVAYGGVPRDDQVDILKKGCDILVATPGHLLDFLQRKTIYLDQLRILVLDEADILLSCGERVDRKPVTCIGRQVASILHGTQHDWDITQQPSVIRVFISATLLDSANRSHIHTCDKPASLILLALCQTKPMLLDLNGRKSLATRFATLIELLNTKIPKKTIVFTATRAEADALHLELSSHADLAKAIVVKSQGGMAQQDREEAFTQFHDTNRSAIIVSPGTMARGINITRFVRIIHYQLSQTNPYLEWCTRNGRTARAGYDGEVITLYMIHIIPKTARS